MSFKSAVAFSATNSEKEAAIEISSKLSNKIEGQWDVIIIFASSQYDYQDLLAAIREKCDSKNVIGCSSAGEFISGSKGEGSVSCLAIQSTDMVFNPVKGLGLREDRKKVAQEINNKLIGLSRPVYKHRSLLLLADALAGHTDELIEELNQLSAGGYQFFGGGAGDDAKFSKTHVFLNDDVYTDGVVGLEILSQHPLGIGVQHGWEPSGELMRVTDAEGSKVKSLNSTPSAEVFEEYAKSTSQNYDPQDPMPFFLHNTLAIQTSEGLKIRVPLSIDPDGSISFASDIPAGSTVTFMKSTADSSVAAAKNAVEFALAHLEGRRAGAALFFDCVATRLRMGEDFGMELEALQKALGPEVNLAGCNTYGQIARVDKQFSGFHNCTAVVCVFPES